MSAVLDLQKNVEKAKGNGTSNYDIKPFQITVKTYDLMIKHGILTENDNVELLDGEIIEKMPKGTDHSLTTDIIAEFFYSKLLGKCLIRNQNPIWLETSEPEPDLVLCKLPREKYRSQHPKPEDIHLIIEVSDSTLFLDRTRKANVYARAGIEHYLIVNIENHTVEDYRQPSADGFQWKQTYKIGDKFNLIAFPEIEINVTDFFQNEG
jgi:hypothetical protein